MQINIVFKFYGNTSVKSVSLLSLDKFCTQFCLGNVFVLILVEYFVIVSSYSIGFYSAQVLVS